MKKSIVLSFLLIMASRPMYSSDNNVFKKLSAIAACVGAGYIAYNWITSLCRTHASIKPALAQPMSAAKKTQQSTIDYVPVLQQKDPATKRAFMVDRFWQDIFEHAEGSNCGYHALKNALIALKGGFKISSDRTKNPIEYQKVVRPWIEEIQRKNQQRTDNPYPFGNMITSSDIEYLLQKFQPDYVPFITVVDSFEIFEKPEKMSFEAIAVLEKIVTNKSGLHVFIVNTDALHPAAINKGYHWVAYVVSKIHNNIAVSEMNSLGRADAALGKKILQLCSLQQKEISEKRNVIQLEQQKLALESEQIDRSDIYTLQDFSIVNCSIGLVDFKDLSLQKLLQNKTSQEQANIKKAFEDCFGDRIAEVRKSRFVMIDGQVDSRMTLFREAEILKDFPNKNYVFTLWKSSKSGQWHVEYDIPADINQFIRTRTLQSGVKGKYDRALRFS